MSSQASLIADRYSIVAPLGEGGVGQVFKCRDVILNNFVAVKVLRANATDIEMSRFHKEAKTMARLVHPNIVKILSFDQTTDGRPFLVMEYCSGSSLERLLKENVALEFEASYPILRDVCSALAYAHQQGVLHRDVKPSNIILTETETGEAIAKICDFGIAKLQHDDQNQELTRAGSAVGSPAYISPEAARGTGVDPRSDIYGFGCMFFETLTGVLPFSGETEVAMMMARLDGDIPTLHDTTGEDFPPSLEEIVAKCLALDPDERFSSAEELGAALDAAYEVLGDPVTVLFGEGEATAEQAPFGETERIVDGLVGGVAPRPQKLIHPSSILIGLAILAVSGIVAAFLMLALLGTEDRLDETMSALSDDDSSDWTGRKVVTEHIDGHEWIRIRGLCSAKDVNMVLGRKNVHNLKMTHDDLRGDGLGLLAEHKLPIRAMELSTCLVDDRTLKALGGLKSLRSLNLEKSSGLTAKGLAELAHCKHLERLDLKETDCSDNCIAGISRSSNLKELDLRRCSSLSGASIGALRALGKLEELKLSASGFRPANMKKLNGLEHLRRLELCELALTDSDLDNLKVESLKKLDLADNELTDRSLSALARLSNLHDLFLGGNKGLSIKAMKEFCRKHPGVSVHY